jgi:SAM-dependent methyltransferase
MKGELVEAEHLVRYLWASSLARGRRVLDAGCGVGYGTRLLAEGGAVEAIGVDVAAAVVEAAGAAARPGVGFRCADVRDLPFADGEFGLVVCFEVIEHIEHRDRALREMVRVLAHDGVLLISSPNRDVYVTGNPHHVHEYRPQELRGAVAEHLPHVALRRQHDWIASAVLRDEDAQAEGLERLDGPQVAKAVGAAAGSEQFTIVLASRAPLPEDRPVLAMTGLVEVRKWLDLWHQQQDVLTRQHEAFQQLRADAELVAGLSDELARHESARYEHDALAGRVAELEDELRRLRGELGRTRAALQTVYDSKSWRITEPVRTLRQRLAPVDGHGAGPSPLSPP